MGDWVTDTEKLNRLRTRLGWTEADLEHFITCNECYPIGCTCCQTTCADVPDSTYTNWSTTDREAQQQKQEHEESVAKKRELAKVRREEYEAEIEPFKDILP